MLQQETPMDLVLGTGEAHSVKEFVQAAFSYVGLDWQAYVDIDPRYFRPTEVELLLADPQEARTRLNWEPRIGFGELVKIMLDVDLEAAGLTSPSEGKRILREGHLSWLRKP